MLYERWRHIALERAGECALTDLSTNRHWTFAQLAQLAETESEPSPPLVFPQGHSPGFVVSVLKAWRKRSVVCPIEVDQPAPPVITLPPRGGLHLKATSATTGAARFVAFTDRQLMADAENIVTTMGLRPDWPNLALISMAHSYGFSNLVLPLLLHGIPLLIAPSPLPEIFRQTIKRADIPAFTLPAVPALWRTWHEAGVLSDHIALAVSAGAPLPLNLETSVFSSTGIKIHNFYGASECGGIAYDDSKTPRTSAAIGGRPMRNVNLSVGENGCLIVQSQAVAESYWPLRTDSLGNGIFQTTDLAEINEGQVFLKGRCDDQIHVAGRKVSPETIERALLQHPQVRECLVFGIPCQDEERIETIVAVVAADIGESVLKEFLLKQIPAWQIPRAWRFVKSLPTSARGKVSRAKWRQTIIAETHR